MEHPLIRLKAATGRGTGVLAMEAANTQNAPSARQTWSYWLRGKRAPNLAQLARLVRMAQEAGEPELAIELPRWGTALALELEEAPTVALSPEQLAEDARADARWVVQGQALPPVSAGEPAARLWSESLGGAQTEK